MNGFIIFFEFTSLKHFFNSFLKSGVSLYRTVLGRSSVSHMLSCQKKKKNFDRKPGTDIYRRTEIFLMDSIAAWYGNCSAHSLKPLQRVLAAAQHHWKQTPDHSGYLPPAVPVEGTRHHWGRQPPSTQAVLLVTCLADSNRSMAACTSF